MPINQVEGDGALPARRSGKVAEYVARAVVQDIADRQLPVGTVLPGEAAMLERLQVGRASLREGLRILEVHGIISMKTGPGGGPIVAAASARDFGRMAVLHLQVARTTLRELLDARRVMEPLMARLVATHPDPAALAELRAVVEEARVALHDGEEYSLCAEGFHAALAGASGNRVLDLFGHSIEHLYSDRVGTVPYPREDRERVQAAHEEILATIEAGDAAEAERLMDVHMEGFLNSIAGRHPGLLDQALDWR